jgi:putative pyruvate formate lyase activating enzyme
MLILQKMGCHNINFVSPSHFVPQLIRSVLLAIPMGLNIPLIYNSNGYDSLKTLKELDGIIDIYLPDLKYADDTWAKKFSQAKNYVATARAAIKEMWRQVGRLELNDEGVALKGIVVRHLILPQNLAGTDESLRWLAKYVSRNITVSLMSQYYPRHRATRIPQLARIISKDEYTAALKMMRQTGLEDGWIQGMGSPQHYLPDFARKGHPFT